MTAELGRGTLQRLCQHFRNCKGLISNVRIFKALFAIQSRLCISCVKDVRPNNI